MAGTLEGGRAAAVTNKRKYGKNFYRKIGKIGGAGNNGGIHLKGFGTNRKLARKVGARGGRISRRGFERLVVVPPKKSIFNRIFKK